MNRLDAMIRDIPRCCPCRWEWNRWEHRWELTGLRRDCPHHWPARVAL